MKTFSYDFHRVSELLVAASNKSIACMQYLDKLKEVGMIDDEQYKKDLTDIGKNLLHYKF